MADTPCLLLLWRENLFKVGASVRQIACAAVAGQPSLRYLAASRNAHLTRQKHRIIHTPHTQVA